MKRFDIESAFGEDMLRSEDGAYVLYSEAERDAIILDLQEAVKAKESIIVECENDLVAAQARIEELKTCLIDTYTGKGGWDVEAVCQEDANLTALAAMRKDVLLEAALHLEDERKFGGFSRMNVRAPEELRRMAEEGETPHG